MKTIKTLLCSGIIAALCLFTACNENAVIRQSYNLTLPGLPEAWLEVLGEARWHIEWVDEDGSIQSVENESGSKASVYGIMQEWATPVTAWPYWPEKGIKYGLMKPAGAIFPIDVSGSRIKLSWNAGIDAVFYWELAARGSEKRLPHQFNWKRFRELFSSKDLSEEILQDPWLADWEAIAVKTAASGFDRRRISPKKYSTLNLAIPAGGPWIGVSPFMQSNNWLEQENVLIKVTDQTGSYLCPTGILRCSSGAWIWITYTHNQ
jgi:hypothetical protein